MSVTIKLYENMSEPNRLDKTKYLQLIEVITGELRSDVNILSPIIEVEIKASDIFIAALVINYVYIVEFKRYYYVTSFDVCNGNTNPSDLKVLVRLYLRVDVLMSWGSNISALSGVVDRQEKQYNNRIIDNNLPVLPSCTLLRENAYYQNNKPNPFIDFSSNATATFDSVYCYVITLSDICRGGLSKTLTSIGYGCSSYVCTPKQIRAIIQYILTATWKSNLNYLFTNPTEAIISIKCFPFNILEFLPADRLTYDYNKTKTIYIGNTYHEFSDIGEFYNVHDNLKVLINVTRGFRKDDLKYEPGSLQGYLPTMYYKSTGKTFNKDYSFLAYTDYQIYLPYYGFFNIDYNKYCDVSDNDIYINVIIRYLVDITTGDTTIILSNRTYPFDTQANINKAMNDVDHVTDIINFNIAVDCPYSYTNINDIEKSKLFAGIKLGTIAMSSYSNFLSGMPIEPPMQLTPKTQVPTKQYIKEYSQYQQDKQSYVYGNLSNDINNISNLVIGTMKEMQYKINSTVLDNTFNKFIINNVAFIQMKLPDVDEYENYAELNGRPCNKYMMIANLEGYTKFSLIHVDIQCTEEERKEIEQILKSGFYCPYKTK